MIRIRQRVNRLSSFFQDSVYYVPFNIQIFYLLDLKKMGCADSKSDVIGSSQLPSSTIQKNNNQIQQKILQNSQMNKNINKQDLTLSDYQAFLKKSQEEGRTDYPSAFKFINIVPISNQEISTTKKQEVDPLRCTRAQLANLATQIIMQNGFSKSTFNFSNIKAFTQEIASRYNSVSYHNFSHGFALMQMLYRCLKRDSSLAKIYSEQQITFYLIAGLGHDVNHNGTNNLYQTKLNTELAKKANNESVLQKMHLRTLLQISQSRPQFDVLSLSSNPQQQKQKITRVILATDMAKHFPNLQKLKSIRNSTSLPNVQDKELKIQLMQNIVHACDIGNGLLTNSQYMNWGGLLTYQFNQQTKLEQKFGVPVTQFLRFKGIGWFYSDQVGFLGTFVIPLWAEISGCFTGIQDMFLNCQQNLAIIQSLKQQQANKEQQKKD